MPIRKVAVLASDYPKKPLTDENILSVLPASVADIFYQLGHDDAYQNIKKRRALMDTMSRLYKEKKVTMRSRTADDPVYYKA